MLKVIEVPSIRLLPPQTFCFLIHDLLSFRNKSDDNKLAPASVGVLARRDVEIQQVWDGGLGPPGAELLHRVQVQLRDLSFSLLS